MLLQVNIVLVFKLFPTTVELKIYLLYLREIPESFSQQRSIVLYVYYFDQE